MSSGNERNVVEPGGGAMSSTWRRLGTANEHWPMWWRRTNGELCAFDRLELLGWDEA